MTFSPREPLIMYWRVLFPLSHRRGKPNVITWNVAYQREDMQKEALHLYREILAKLKSW